MDCNVFIIHGIYGSPEENWFPWLKKELELLGCRVFVPRFPNPANPKFNEWMEFLDKFKEHLNEDSIVVGHSLGVTFLLSVLEKYSAKAAFFVASVTPGIKNEFSWQMKTFIDKKPDWSKIKNNCKNFFIYNSDNDPYIPLSKGEELAKNLDSKLKIIKNAGHFNEKAGYKKFELLLKDIKNLITKHL
tara:strand:+ start:8798 stop:9361 length:564 start_codon:yes stop_codon:yes gene_type:complete